jgi:putative ABC transport system permease protein
LGLRRAVGAQTTDILILVAREGMRAPLLGLALGCGLAALGSNQLTSMLYGVAPDDAAVWGVALGTLAMVSLAACAWAARLAVRVHPVNSLRSE